MSSVPEITEAEAAPKNPPALKNSTKTTTTTDSSQTTDQDETSKQDSTNTLNTAPKQDFTGYNPQNDPPKQDSPDDNTQDGSTKQNDAANTDPEQDSATSKPQNEPPKQDSPDDNPPGGNNVQDTANTDPNSRSCLPLPGFCPQKRAKPESKKPADVPEHTYSKEDLATSIAAEIKYIQDELDRLHKCKDQVDSGVEEALDLLKRFKEEDQDCDRLRALKKEVTKLKLQLPKQKADVEDKDLHKDQHARTLRLKLRDKLEEKMKMPLLYKDDLFVNSLEFKDLEARFNQLPIQLKLCLLCFSIFPGNEDIKKRLMVYWWMTEGFVPPIHQDDGTRNHADEKTAEAFAEEFIEKLRKEGFIEPVNKKRSLGVGSYRMHPFISSALVRLAEKAKFFDFDNSGNPTEKFSQTLQACLVGRGLIDYQDLRTGNVGVHELENIHTVINVNEPILEFKKEWLLEMKNVNILYLGRWKASATHHIEVEDEEEKDFLDGLKNMKHLKFFSLQGVSRIMELPESISELANLMILDLRACHNLESIPEKIGLLKNLTHLDISECYLLERMPKGIASLSELRVLKGFVVGKSERSKGSKSGRSERSKHSCSLEDLAKLGKLAKLSIYTGLMEFPETEHIAALGKLKSLRKLTIAWGGDALKVPSSKSTPDADEQTDGAGERKKKNAQEKSERQRISDRILTSNPSPLPKLEHLEKLDLKSFPMATTPPWLKPSSLVSLKKLYIRGGKFSDLGQYQLNNWEIVEGTTPTWNVKILRLKYLNKLEMDWGELQELFPNLIYLEKVNCPKLSFFPCDGYGVWINQIKLKQMQETA